MSFKVSINLFISSLLWVAAIILSYLSGKKCSISRLAGELPSAFMVKRKIAITPKGLSFERIKKTFKGGRADMRDGIKLVFDDSWFQVRLSNTEPVARLLAESLDKKK